MQYISTRNKNINVSGAEAVVQGLSAEGGLFVPCEFPKISLNEINDFGQLEYNELASAIISKFLPQLSDKLPEYCAAAYSRFDGYPAPLLKIEDSFYLELFHGPTYAFKDIALTLLPHLLVGSKKELGKTEKTLILVATSGDTGKAALEGFKDVDGTSVLVFYPDGGVSNLQKLQMQTQQGGNVKVVAIKGNFDDAQNAVKEIFLSKDIAKELAKKGVELSSANSINFGRLVPQIVYYFSSYTELVLSKQIKLGDKINFCVPTGNFGNILAGYYAYKMGLPINKLICASNQNNVLTDFILNGRYDIKAREFFKTTSPSMDILISSNLERLIFELSGRDDKLTLQRMENLKKGGSYNISESELKKLKELFYSAFAAEQEVNETINEIFDDSGYIIDTHTAVAVKAYNDYKKATGDKTKTVIVSTASPYKFTNSVLEALGEKVSKSDQQNVYALEEITALPIPESLEELFTLKAIHKEIADKTETSKKVLEFALSK